MAKVHKRKGTTHIFLSHPPCKANYGRMMCVGQRLVKSACFQFWIRVENNLLSHITVTPCEHDPHTEFFFSRGKWNLEKEKLQETMKEKTDSGRVMILIVHDLCIHLFLLNFNSSSCCVICFFLFLDITKRREQKWTAIQEDVYYSSRLLLRHGIRFCTVFTSIQLHNHIIGNIL